MGLAARSRKLVAARGLDAGKRMAPRGLAWTSIDVEVDRSTLRRGQRVVADHVIVARTWPDQPDQVSIRERIAMGPGDGDRVLAWDGTLIGFPVFAKRGGCVYDFVWPEGLPARDPKTGAGA